MDYLNCFVRPPFSTLRSSSFVNAFPFSPTFNTCIVFFNLLGPICITHFHHVISTPPLLFVCLPRLSVCCVQIPIYPSPYCCHLFNCFHFFPFALILPLAVVVLNHSSVPPAFPLALAFHHSAGSLLTLSQMLLRSVRSTRPR